MTTFFIYGAQPAPAAIADEKGNVVVFKHVIDMFWLERFARHVAVDMGAAAGFAIAPMSMEFVRRTAVPGTVTQALRIGETVLDARAKRQNVVDRVIETTGATLFFTGKVTDIRRELIGGFARGQALLVRHRPVGGLGRAHRHPEREPGAVDRRRAGDHGAGPDHQSRARYRRADHHGGAALRPAHRRHRPAGARPHEDAARAGDRRPEGLRLSRPHLHPARTRNRLPLEEDQQHENPAHHLRRGHGRHRDRRRHHGHRRRRRSLCGQADGAAGDPQARPGQAGRRRRIARRRAGRARLHDGRTDRDDREAAARRRADERLPPARAIARPQDRRGAVRRGRRHQFDDAVRGGGGQRPAAGRRRRHGPRLS